MRKFVKIIGIFIVLVFASGYLIIKDSPVVAIVTIVKNKVSVKEPDGKNWVKAKKGTTLKSGSYLKTDEKSFSLVKFLDGSFLRVGENTVVEIIGENPRGDYARKVHIDNGKIDFKITKVKGKFEFTTPLSVASIRGTEGLFTSSPEADTLIVREGIIDFLNKISNRRITLRGGQTGVSDRKGNVVAYKTTEGEKKKAEEFRRKVEEKKEREIIIKGRDREGREIEIRIKIKE